MPGKIPKWKNSMMVDGNEVTKWTACYYQYLATSTWRGDVSDDQVTDHGDWG